jgi:hypothetical protein
MNKHPRAQREDVRRERPDDANAFVPDTTGQLRPLPASDAEAFAEEFIGSATGGEPVMMDAVDEVVDEEDGGPYIVLDEDAALPAEPAESSGGREEQEPAEEGHEPVQEEEGRRGARWAAKGV